MLATVVTSKFKQLPISACMTCTLFSYGKVALYTQQTYVGLGLGLGLGSPPQWRRQDLLRGGTKIEIMSWGTHGGLHGRVQQLLDD